MVERKYGRLSPLRSAARRQAQARPLLLGDHPGHVQGLPLILGEAPSSPSRVGVYFPLSGAVGKRLCQFAGIEPQAEGSEYGRWYWALREQFDCLNAIERHEDAYPWRVEVARSRWHEHVANEGRPLTVVCLGAKAADAVRLHPNATWGEWLNLNGMAAVKIPHPSGRCRLYNDEAMRTLAGRVLREAMA